MKRAESSFQSGAPFAQALPPEEEADLAQLSTASYAEATLTVLHHALMTVRAEPTSAQLDALESALQHLSNCCRQTAMRLDRLKFEQSGHLLAHRVLEVEAQRAAMLANTVDGVWRFVRGRALGELDRSELHATWLQLWGALAPVSRQSEADPAQ